MNSTRPCEFKILRVRECAPAPLELTTAEQGAQYWRANIANAPWFDACKEAFVVLVLNTRRRIVGHNLVSLGSLDSTGVHPREVFAPAIAAAAAAIVLMHNHPSGDPTPSEADLRATRDLIRAGQLLRIEVLDHLIIGESHTSLRELGVFG